MENLDPELCALITTLKKMNLFFLTCLPSIKNSNRRSNEQALAIYLYWLKLVLLKIFLCFLVSNQNKESQNSIQGCNFYRIRSCIVIFVQSKFI